MVVDGTQFIVDETISDSKRDRKYVVVGEAINTLDFEVKKSEIRIVLVNEDVVDGVGVIVGVVVEEELPLVAVEVVVVVVVGGGGGVVSGTGTGVVIVMDVVDIL